MISEKELKNYLDLKDKIEERILEIFYYSSNYEPNGGYNYFEIEGDMMYVHWSNSWNYGGYEEGTTDFPTILLNEDYKKYYDYLINKNKIKEENALKLVEEYQKASDLKKLKELKDKYENN